MVLQTLVPLVVLASSVVPARAVRPGPEIVIASEALVAGGPHVPDNLNAFLRRLETVGGWPSGSLRGKAFTRPKEALAYIRANKVPFAILPPHQLVEARKELKLEILGRAVGLEGTRPGYWGVTLAGKRPYEHIEEEPGLRLALTESYDEQWLRVLLEGNVSAPAQHFKLVEVPTAADAVAAVLARKADVAMLYQSDFVPLKPRMASGGDLAWVYASDGLPPPAIVSVNRHSPPAADRKRFTAALEKLCKGDGADACARMGIVYVEVGRAESYNVVIQKYAQFH
jgi:ABC-type phosphate/phosphonate transport system substrate-binding protein